ncbi:phosphoenolpyruvate--protein phosphotransferase [Treponema sp. J25]|uniref:phosphoenolpyruvate--protein phosphotransferase n=1 Tax=Treponema sp. J25 TaxID=2094121 RepID=UPI0010442C64|nr:phosphoenolpyruvate--protein phosphotransferase [Treponema sp. J25]TCW60924.1 phosphoenolpyruvate--protein phosphotransferase [Treponema sp. J25]
MTYRLQGIPASTGIAIGPLVRYREQAAQRSAPGCDAAAVIPDQEWALFSKALERSREQVTLLRDKTAAELGQEKAEIFASHLSILKDPEFLGEVRRKIFDEHKDAAAAVRETGLMFMELLRQLEDELFTGRIRDIEDIVSRIVQNMQGTGEESIKLVEPSVLAAVDLTPSQTAQMDRSMVLGFVTEGGSAVSHSSILARSLGLPAVVGIGPLPEVVDGTTVIVDGNSGMVILNPDSGVLSEYEEKRKAYEAELQLVKAFADKPSLTKDGLKIEIAANIGSIKDLEGAIRNGADGIGLFRTEFMFMDRTAMPSEDEQFEVYKHVLERMKGKPVVIRTLDVGGDKQIPYIHLEPETNPFLGLRAIRLCLEKEDLLRTQIRALLRASVFGTLRILLPMVATLEELRRAKTIIIEEEANLKKRNIPVSETWELGIMIEIPSAALLADHFAPEVDFFSVGTNDLTQYTMAADRMNRSVAYLNRGLSPAVLRLVDMASRSAKAHGIWIGVCGELAGDPEAFALFVGLGITELSMGAASVPRIRSRLAALVSTEAAQWAERALRLESAEAIHQYISGVIG